MVLLFDNRKKKKKYLPSFVLRSIKFLQSRKKQTDFFDEFLLFIGEEKQEKYQKVKGERFPISSSKRPCLSTCVIYVRERILTSFFPFF